MQKVDNKNAVWIGTSNTRNAGPLLAIVPGNFNSLMSGLTVGDRVNVTGTVEKAPPSSRTQHNFKISSEDAKMSRPMASTSRQPASLGCRNLAPASPEIVKFL